MEELQRELDEARSAIEKLSAELRLKSAFSDSLRRAHTEQQAKLQEAKAEIERHTAEVAAKGDEIAAARQLYAETKSTLAQKETALKQVSAAAESLKCSFRDERAAWEKQAKDLVSALDEANCKKDEQERMSRACRLEIDRLKGLLELSQRKCSEAEKRAESAKESRRAVELLSDMEQEKEKLEERLKWKCEQFKHLEEAYNKMQTEFRAYKKGCDREKAGFLEEIGTLQTNLDSQIRLGEDLRSQLHMCNQALAHEESRRKLLEIQISESKALYENVIVEYEEARSHIETLTARREGEVAELRNSLATKATLLKETEFLKTHLELENQELKKSLNELREAQINEVDSSVSLKNLRNKFKALEHAHRVCLEEREAAEVEWTSCKKKLQEELDGCLERLNHKDEQICDLQVELEGSLSSLIQLKLDNEETWIARTILESKFLESFSKLEQPSLELDTHSSKAKEDEAEIKKQVMVHEASMNLTKKVTDLQNDLMKASDALDHAKSALAEKTTKILEVESRAHQLKTVVEQTEKLSFELKAKLAKCNTENNELRRDLEICSVASLDAEKMLIQEKERYILLKDEKDRMVEELQKRLVLLEDESARREVEAVTLAKLAMEKVGDKLLQIKEDVDKMVQGVLIKLDHLEQKYEQIVVESSTNLKHEVTMIQSVEEEFRSVKKTLMLRLTEKEFEVDAIYSALEKIVTANILDNQEDQGRRFLVNKLEKIIETLQFKLLAEEKKSSNLAGHVNRLETEKMVEMLEKEKQKAQAEIGLASMKRSKRTVDSQLAQLTLERNEQERLMMGINDLIVEVFQKDKELLGNWERVVKKASTENTTDIKFSEQDFLICDKVDGAKFIYPPGSKGVQDSGRSPLKEHNC